MENKDIIKHFYEVISSNAMVDQFDKYVSKNCTIRIGEEIIPVGIEGMKQHLIDVRKTYPDLRITVIRQYCDGDYVISEILTEGTHKGEWLNMKPTGKKLVFTGVDIDKIIDGKIVEHGGAVNTFETLFEAKIIQPSP